MFQFVTLPHFGFQARFSQFVDAIWSTFELVRRMNTEKFCTRTFGARELELILVVMRAEKMPF